MQRGETTSATASAAAIFEDKRVGSTKISSGIQVAAPELVKLGETRGGQRKARVARDSARRSVRHSARRWAKIGVACRATKEPGASDEQQRVAKVASNDSTQ
eukprot:517050-Pleurochrysis_carterae.AAC.1